MKTIGLIGGMSWKSSLDYYNIINETVHDKLGGWHSAKIILYSVDFDEIDFEHQTSDWKKSDAIVINAAKTLEKAGCDIVILGANTAHILADTIQKNIKIPLLHVADATAEKIKEANITKIGLLGTKYTMTQQFYKRRLEEKYGLKVILPDTKEMEIVNTEINNIILGKDSLGNKKKFVDIINNLVKKGAEGIILGCTEIPLIISQKDVNIPLFDTVRIHAESAAEYALK